MMIVFVYRFEDCINACASYNAEGRDLQPTSNCTAVTYWPRFGESGNCWLKGASGMPEVSHPGSDSAKLLES